MMTQLGPKKCFSRASKLKLSGLFNALFTKSDLKYLHERYYTVSDPLL
ncbi:MAG: hypothetical protein OFPI_12880 [Osedax symbiont Rs2]|nr:MAG: hypothetical protein OFPI_12880 [Osedax symbiont Rs2]